MNYLSLEFALLKNAFSCLINGSAIRKTALFTVRFRAFVASFSRIFIDVTVQLNNLLYKNYKEN
jgi:hypothetical protein